jgi:hypothetical protein
MKSWTARLVSKTWAKRSFFPRAVLSEGPVFEMEILLGRPRRGPPLLAPRESTAQRV